MKTKSRQEVVMVSKLISIQPRSWAAVLLIVTLLASAMIARAGGLSMGGKPDFDTMTANLYVGGNIGRVITLDPTDPGYLSNLVYTVTGVFYQIQASEPEARLQGLADAIARRMPDVVSVQEASLIRIQSPGDLVLGGTNGATQVAYDFLQILVQALNARGAHYAIASSAERVDVEMPAMNMQTGGFDDVRLTDRDAILVRTDLPRGQFRVSNPRSGNFAYIIQIPTMGLDIKRGWCSIDVFTRGRVFRYINTHLEEETVPQLQVLQVNELLSGPAKTCLPVILVGDFNADSLHRDGSIAYDSVTAGGFKDSWANLNPRNCTGGLTWGHDENLADPSSLFDRRIDFVFYRGASFFPARAEVLNLKLNRTEAPFWTSDHAVLAVKFQPGREPIGNGR